MTVQRPHPVRPSRASVQPSGAVQDEAGSETVIIAPATGQPLVESRAPCKPGCVRGSGII